MNKTNGLHNPITYVGLCIFAWILSPCIVLGQDFADSTQFAFPGFNGQGIYNAAFSWGDYDNDGDVDLFVLGDTSNTSVTTILKNTSGVFANDAAADGVLVDVRRGEILLTDYNNDNFLDALIIGESAGGVASSTPYLNNGSGGYAIDLAFDAVLTDIKYGSGAWGDIDNDGDRDLVLVGRGAAGPVAQLYTQGASSFAVSLNFTALDSASAAMEDFNADGLKDVLIAGYNAGIPQTLLYLNQGDGIFVETPSSLPNLGSVQIACADFDNDGQIDLAMTGRDGSGTLLGGIYKNASGAFSLTFALPGVVEASLSWGDYNEDGASDLVLTGFTGTDTLFRIYDNTLPTFTENSLNGGLLAGILGGKAVFGDYNTNGVLDIVYGGIAKGDTVFQLFENILTDGAALGAPGSLSTAQSGDTTFFNWEPPTGFTEGSVSYRLVVSDVSGGTNLLSPIADLSTGRSKWAYKGSESVSGPFYLIGLEEGDYFWRVQAIDRSHEGGGFSPERTFKVESPDINDTSSVLGVFAGQGRTNAIAAWGDVDNDGRLDLVISGDNGGTPAINLLRNNGANFIEAAQSFDPVVSGALAWNDFNADGFIDLLITGNSSGTPISKLYKNNGDFTFTEIPAGFQGLSNSSASWGDIDLDGDQDLLLTGDNAGTGAALLYRNEGDDTFTSVAGTGITGILNGQGSFSDFDKDGDLDLILSGNNAGSDFTQLYKNDGAGIFSSFASTITGFSNTQIEWSDINNDTYPDVIMAGSIAGIPSVSVFVNDAGVSFSLQPNTLDGIVNGSVVSGDYDEDGDKDLLLLGQNGIGAGDRTAKLYRNNNGIGFVLDTLNTTALIPVNSATASWIDYDNDGKLDLFYTGEADAPLGRIAKLYRNELTLVDDKPGTPQNLETIRSGQDYLLSWEAPSGVPALNGLSYNVYIGLQAGDDNVKPALANLATTGKRKVVEVGPQQATILRLPDPKGGTYYWSVQAIDGDYESSPFAPENQFVVDTSFFVGQALSFGSVVPPVQNGMIAWGDINNDGLLDLAYAGKDGANPVFKLIRNNGANPPTDITLVNILGVESGDLAWGDYNADGLIDLLVTGKTDGGSTSKLFKNNGDLTFTEVSTSFPGLINSSASWGDYDQDGDQDLLLTGDNAGTGVSIVYRNEGGDVFTEVNALGLAGLSNGMGRFADYDRDGDLDILLSGQRTGADFTQLYNNDGNGAYSAQASGLPALSNSRFVWTDVNNDGFLDLLIAGTQAGVAVTSVYLNSAGTGFTLQPNALDAVINGTILSGDYNEDGWRDLFITGQNGPLLTDRSAKLYRNNNGTGFLFDSLNSSVLVPVNSATGSWADIDNNGKLDLFYTGIAASGNDTVLHYRNNATAPDTKPLQPQNLSLVRSGNDLIFNWQAPAGFANASGLSYNLYIGTQPGTDNRKPALANLVGSGKRRIVQSGPIQGTNWKLKTPAKGRYYWSVQAIDGDFEGSLFSGEQTYLIDTSKFVNQSAALSGLLPVVSEGSAAWGDVNNDGLLDLAITGNDSANIQFKLIRNNGGALPTDITPPGITGIEDGDISFTDYNSDGFLDLLLTGKTSGGSQTRLYKNNGDLSFTEVSAGFPGLVGSSAAWGDIDNDGDLDLLLTGESTGTGTTLLYRNNGVLGFSEEIGTGLSGLINGMGGFADYDRDGDLDILLSGNSGGSDFTQLYKNDGAANFTPEASGIVAMSNSSLEWSDVNNDGFADVLIAGEQAGTLRTRVYLNNAGTTFTLQSNSLDGIINGSVVSGDYNEDGWKDLFLVGQNGPLASDRAAKLYLNNNGAGFVFDSLSSSVLSPVSAALGSMVDFDKSGKLDLFYVGNAGAPLNGIVRFYRNDFAQPNTTPASPASLASVQNGTEVNFTWQAPAGFPSPNALTYNLYISSSPGKDNIKPALSALGTSGFRRVVASGPLRNTSWTWKNVLGGTYYWSVQAIDSDYEGTLFSTEASLSVQGSVFTDVTQTAFGSSSDGLQLSNLIWGDIDNDDDLDLIAIGDTANTPTTILYINNGGGNFTRSSQTLTALREGSLSLGDIDLDGDLDLVMSGSGIAGPTTHVYRNNGAGTFQLLNQPGLVGLTRSDTELGDYDQDGDLDLLIAGSTGSVNITRLYTNNGSGIFTASSVTLAPVSQGDLAWLDFDIDGDLDIVLTGLSDTGSEARIYRNNGSGVFAEISGTGLLPVRNSSFDWGDYNKDGFPDLLISGNNGTQAICNVYRNNSGNGTFTPLAASISGIQNGKAVWADYNEDGNLDFVIAGQSGPAATSRIIELYDGNGTTFTKNIIDAGIFRPVNNGAALAWGDFDKDGKIDLALAGKSGEPATTAFRLYKNNLGTANQLPAAPGNLTATRQGQDLLFTWTPPAGASGLSYQLYIGTNPAISNKKPSHANTGTGYRRLIKVGDVQQATRWLWKAPKSGDYYWSVQSIDQDYEGSAFAPEASISIDSSVFVNSTASILGALSVGLSKAASDWGDYNNDGFLDLAVSGESGSTPFTAIYQNFGGAGFVLPSGLAITQLKNGSPAWGDYNNDNALDLILTGEDLGGNPVTQLYANNGSGTLTLRTGTGLPPLTNSSVHWGDYDKDGYSDLILSGRSTGGTVITRIMKNNGGAGTFTAVNVALDGIQGGAAKWLDMEGDGDLDIALSGNGLTRIYKNEGKDLFVLSQTLEGLSNADLDIIDYDNDGDIDFIATGNNGAGNVTRIYQNNGKGSFQQVLLPGVIGVESGSIKWGDFNNDGLADFVLTGRNGSTNADHETRLYRQLAGGTFALSYTNSLVLTDLGDGSVANWGDYNKDGKLDLFLLGKDTTGLAQMQLFTNTISTGALALGAPQNLIGKQVGTKILLTWSKPSGYPAEQASGLNYNYYLGTTSKTGDRKSPLSDINSGFRKVVRHSNTANDTVILENVAEGTYFWSVQAINPSFQGSAFAQEQTFVYTKPDFVQVTDTVFSTLPIGINTGDLAAGDYDGDGDLDLLASGLDGSSAASIKLYRNDGAGNFAELNINVPAFSNGSAEWADIDKDGDLDLLICGRTGTGTVTTEIYRNTAGVFAATNAGLPGMEGANASFADYDRDGDLDLAIAGLLGANPATKLFKNTGGVFTEVSGVNFIGISSGAVAWGDYDKDGLPDLAITGLSADQGPVTRLYRNADKDVFVEIGTAGLLGLELSDIAWGDYNNDGRPDLAVAGKSTNGLTRIYRNNGGNNFSVAFDLANSRNGSVAWGDYDNDGFRDLLVTGDTDEGKRFTKIYKNNNGASFTLPKAANILLDSLGQGSEGIWLDINGDGKLDLATIGKSANPNVSNLRLYKNIKTISGGLAKTGVPQNLAAVQSGDKVVFSWQAPASVPATLVEGLSYNLIVTKVSDGSTVVAPMSNAATGLRRVVRNGNTFNNTSWELSGLETGAYTVAVQAITPNFVGSPFTATLNFNFSVPDFLDVTTVAFPTLPVGLSQASLEWADYDGDGDLDFVVSGENQAASPQTLAYKNNAGKLELDVPLSNLLPDITQGMLAWGDYNGDNFPDLLISGLSLGGAKITQLFGNNGTGIFSLVATYTGASGTRIAWADVNNDGASDWVLMGVDASNTPIAKLFINNFRTNPSIPFIEAPQSSVQLQPLINAGLDRLDYDLDGDFDLFASGESGGSPAATLYVNNGDGTLTPIQGATLGITPLRNAFVRVADYNNDGRPDILLMGLNSQNAPRTVILENRTNGTFNQVALANVGDGSGAWADFNADGFIDLLIAGKDINGNRTIRYYGNNAGGGLVESINNSLVFTKIDTGPVLAPADWDGDKKIDLILLGKSSAGGNSFLLYKNRNEAPNFVPQAPTNLRFVQEGDDVLLKWVQPVVPPDARTRALTYNFYLRPDAGVNNIASALSTQQGYRRIIRLGNAGQDTVWRIKGLVGGTYFWSVQSIDVDYEGSAFAPEQTLAFSKPFFRDVTATRLLNGVGVDESDLAWVDYNNDGDLDLMVMGTTLAATSTLRIYNNNSGTLSLSSLTFPGLNGLSKGKAAWADFNRDGFIDLAVCGESSGAPVTRLFRNQGGTEFILDNQSLPGVINGDLAWADIDNDGDLDLYLMGTTTGGQDIGRLYVNNITLAGQQAEFSQVKSFEGIRNGTVKWGDYNKDGYPDLLLTGLFNGGPFTKVYQNDQKGDFFDAGFNLTPLLNSDAQWVDINNDGYLDIALCGSTGTLPQTKIFLYNPTGNTYLDSGIGIIGLEQGSISLGDFDLDGFTDLILTGINSQAKAQTYLYRNVNGTGMTLDPVNSNIFPDVSKGSQAIWGDFDNNKTLDIAISGNRGSERTLRLVRNLVESVDNETPLTPTNLQAIQKGDELIISWTPPAGNGLVAGYTYSVFLGTATNPNAVRPVGSNTITGYRRIVGEGNMGHSTSINFKQLPSGTYVVGVQAVDQDYEGSTFASTSLDYFSPTFTDLTTKLISGNAEGFDNATLDWGDYDLDGDLDILVAGSTATGTATRIYNNGGTQFSNSGITGIAGVADGSARWGDYNNDGRLDILLSGNSNGIPITEVYRNDDGGFTRTFQGTGIFEGEADWADVDGDGRLDFAVTGRGEDGLLAAMYRNLAGNTFEQVNVNIIPLSNSSLAFGDYDNDSDKDLLVVGLDANGSSVARLYRNDGLNGFVNSGITLPGIIDGNLDWGDYDNDGFLDILFSGRENNSSITAVYRNNGASRFDEAFFVASGGLGAAYWGDYNNDGLRDIVQTGLHPSLGRLTRIFKNTGTSFEVDREASIWLAAVSDSDVKWADYDKDGKLDLVLAGTGAGSERLFRIYKNNSLTPGSSPSSPDALQATQFGDKLTLSWNPPANSGTVQSLTYNLYLGKGGDISLVSPMSAPGDGYRRIARMGNVQHTTQWTIENLNTGTYTWSVQAVNAAFQGSAFASPNTFNYVAPDFRDVTRTVIGANPLGLKNSVLAWLDANNDGNLDLLAIGDDTRGVPTASLYRNNGSVLEIQADAGINGLRKATIALGDHNNDNQIDILVMGEDANQLPVTQLYQNSNTSFFQVNDPFPDLKSGSAAFGDVDNDGRQDILISGETASQEYITRLYRNTGNATFQAVFEISGIRQGTVKLGDLDRDSDLDIIVSGSSGSTVSTRIFENQGKFLFAERNGLLNGNAPLEGVVSGSVELADYNNDGLLDLLISGSGNGNQAITKVYTNAGNFVFTGAIPDLQGLSQGTTRWGDFNNDGLSDIAITGNPRATLLYRNTGSGVYFVLEDKSSDVLIDAGEGSALSWGDFDRDGKLDLAVAGSTREQEAGTLRIYKNLNITPNTTPGVPSGLRAVQQGEIVQLTWNAPSTPTGGIRQGLGYNLYVGTTPRGTNIASPLANLNNGFRREVRLGDIRNVRHFLRDLPAGTYYWSIQAIDQDFEGSAFAAEGVFRFTPPAFEDITLNTFRGIGPTGLSQADLAWLDFNSDNRLDLITIGEGVNGIPSAALYSQRSDGTFDLISTATNRVVAVKSAKIALGDFDRDGVTDMAVMGATRDNAGTTIIYRNTAAAFEPFKDLGNISNGDLAWGDYDNDGDLDLALMGSLATREIVFRIFRNDLINGAGDFVVAPSPGIEGLISGDIAWGDYDADGYLDLLMTGRNRSNLPVSAIYKNNGNGTFKLINSGLAGVSGGSCAWADYDNDGGLDALITGDADGERAVWIYKNAGLDRFTRTFTLSPGILEGTAAWGDFNDDGFVDLVFTGSDGPDERNRISSLYINQAGTNFRQDSINSAVFADLNIKGSLAWGDYNRDGKLDLAMVGKSAQTPGTLLRLYKNRENTPNLKPQPPLSLQVTQDADSVIFTWNPPATVPANGYTYNMYIGVTNNPNAIVSAQAEPASGFRRVAQQGLFRGRRWVIKNISEGPYTWGLQSIDQDLEGSSFATVNFNYIAPTFQDITTKTSLSKVFEPMERSALAWGDYNNDKNPDLLATGIANGNPRTLMYENRGVEGFLSVSLFPGLNVSDGVLAWGDMNNDNLIDLFASGDVGGSLISRIYQNIDSGRFEILPTPAIPGMRFGSAAWADCDNDGDQDLLVAGEVFTGGQLVPTTSLLINFGQGEFIPAEGSLLIGIRKGSVGWLDFNKDGLQDIILTGEAATGPVTALYLNRGDYRFEPAPVGLVQLSNSSLSVGDINNDGLPDLALMGTRPKGDNIAFIYRNQGGSFFVATDSLIGAANGSISFGDFDEDGFADLLYSGDVSTTSTVRTTRLYRNNQNARFIESQVNSQILRDVGSKGQSTWADYDQDGKLDILVTGKLSNRDETTAILYKNQNKTGNPTPITPTVIGETVEADRVLLKWFPVSVPPIATGYTYNVVLGSAQGVGDVVTPVADVSDGFRRVIGHGNAGSNTEWTLRDLPSGKYFWSVQAINQEYDESAFARFDTFTYNAPFFIDASLRALPFNAPGYADAALEWGDVDNDGDLDLVASGETTKGPLTVVYANQGNTRFVERQSLKGLLRSSLAWGDYNNDGFLDLILAGSDGQVPFTILYKNDGKGNLEEVPREQIGSALEGVESGAVAWGDVNNDGYLDLLVAGKTQSTGPQSFLYYNRGDGRLATGIRPLPGLTESDIKLADYDNDGDLDIAYCGYTGSDRITGIYRNRWIENRIAQPGENGFETEFKLLSNSRTIFEQVREGNFDWGDMDNDGDLDLLLTGSNATQPITRIYLNEGSDTFKPFTTDLIGITRGKGIWGDYDEDGRLDLLLCGQSGLAETERQTILYRFDSNTQNFVPDPRANILLTDVNNGSDAAFGDFDKNGKLDIVLTGLSSSAPETRSLKIFRNLIPEKDSIPPAPRNLGVSNVSVIRGSTNFKVTFTWDAPDTINATNGFSYNLIFGSVDDGTIRINPLSDTFGVRRVFRLGNVNKVTQWTLEDVPEGRYYWSVQTIDQDFDASRFAPYNEIVIRYESFVDVTSESILETQAPQIAGEGGMELGDIDNDGDLDLLVTGSRTGGKLQTLLYRWTDNLALPLKGNFVLDPIASKRLLNLSFSDGDFGDYDGDGDLDLLICGRDSTGSRATLLYNNKGGGVFELDAKASEPIIDVEFADVAWGDFDNDGDPDILLTGNSKDSARVTRIYRNEGRGIFTRFKNIEGTREIAIEGVDKGAVAWGDYDRDGFLDFIITGENVLGSPLTQIYHNEAEGEFQRKFKQLSTTQFVPVNLKNSSVAWADVNNDGYQDVFITGELNRRFFSLGYHYDPVGDAFTDFGVSASADVKNGTVSWGDYNNDGWTDLLITGQAENDSLVSRVYENVTKESAIGNISFREDIRSSATIRNFASGSALWGDLDRNGKLDIVVAGVSKLSPQNSSFRVYQNTDTVQNRRLLPPRNLRQTIVGNSIRLAWDPPTGYDARIVNGLGYNLYAVRVSDTLFQATPLSDTLSGRRKVVKNGNMGTTLRWDLRLVPQGTYCWAVQTVDQDLEGSVFQKAPSCFTFNPPQPVIIDSLFPDNFVWEGDTTAWIKVREEDVRPNTGIIRRVNFRYKRISGTEWKSIGSIAPSGVQFSQIINNILIDGSGNDQKEIGIEYFFEVIGRFGYNARSDTSYAYITFNKGLNIQLPRNGTTKRAYNIFAIPLQLKDSTIKATLEDDLGGYDIFEWRFYHYLDSVYAEYSKNARLVDLSPGKGYWLITRNNETVNTGEGTTVRANDSNPYEIALRKKGWTQLGNPYNYNILWSEVLRYNDSATVSQLEPLLVYGSDTDSKNDTWNQVNQLNKYHGGFVFSKADTVINLRIPVRQNTSVQRLGPVASLPQAKENPIHLASWEVLFTLESGRTSYNLGGIGMEKKASASADVFDRMLPPRVDGYLDMSFEHTEYAYKEFTKDVVPSAPTYTWDFTVNTDFAGSETRLGWQNYYFGQADKQLYLMDRDIQRLVDMRKTDQYTFTPEGKTRNFRVYYGPQAFLDQTIQPEKVFVGYPYPNPVDETLYIPLSLPVTPNSSSYEVTLKVYNALGQEVANPLTRNLEPGFHEFDWKVGGKTGTRLALGTYFFTLTLKNQGQVSTARGKFIVQE